VEDFFQLKIFLNYNNMSFQYKECCVCLENNVRSIDRTACKHYICRDCTSKLQQSICPMCRAPLQVKNTSRKEEPKTEFYQSYFTEDGIYVPSLYLQEVVRGDADFRDKYYEMLVKGPVVPYHLKDSPKDYVDAFIKRQRDNFDAQIAYILSCGYVPKK
jgi:uncharacterized protein YbaR (Trm112 family)